MSEKEKAMCEKISKLPPELQEKFLDKVDGAVMALDLLDARKEKDNDSKGNCMFGVKLNTGNGSKAVPLIGINQLFAVAV